MIKIKRRRKSSRFRGTHTHGRGFKKKARGSGHRGGKGMAGSGKRADQKKTLILNLYGNDYFGKDRAIRRKQAAKLKAINIVQIIQNLQSFIKKKHAVHEDNTIKIDLSGYKILSQGEVKEKLIITASAASKTAIEKIKKAGGEVIIKTQQL